MFQPLTSREALKVLKLRLEVLRHICLAFYSQPSGKRMQRFLERAEKFAEGLSNLKSEHDYTRTGGKSNKFLL